MFGPGGSIGRGGDYFGQKTAMELEKRARELAGELRDVCLRRHGLGNGYVERLVAGYRRTPTAYDRLPAPFVQALDHAQFGTGAAVRADLLRFAIARLIVASLCRLRSDRTLPETVRNEAEQRWYPQLMDELLERPDSAFDHRDDAFLKDLAVAALKALPVGGAWVVEVSGIARQFLISGGVGQFVEASLYLLGRMKHFKWYYQLHAVDRYLDSFSETSRNACYGTVCELLRLNPQMRGLFGGSWYYDPALASISPHLAYLQQVPRRYGAKVFRVGTTPAAIRLATLKSRKRRMLYETRRYTPAHYLLIWPRKQLFGWETASVPRLAAVEEPPRCSSAT